MAITYRIGHDGRLSVEEMDGNFHYIEDELGNLNSSVSQLEISVDDITTVIAGITASEAYQDATVIAGLTASVITLNTNVAGLTASVITLNTNVAGLTASVITLNTNVAGLTASVMVLEDDVVGLTADVAGLTASVMVLEDDVVGLTADVAGLTASVIDLQNAFSNIDGSFNFLLLVGGVTQSGTFSFNNGILATYSLV